MKTEDYIPFSIRNNPNAPIVEDDFPQSARIGLIHLIAELIDDQYIDCWADAASLLQRICRFSLPNYDKRNGISIDKAKGDCLRLLTDSIEWEKAFDYCEAIYNRLPNSFDRSDFDGPILTIEKSKAEIAKGLNLLFAEENFAYEFSDGKVVRKAKRHTHDQAINAAHKMSLHNLNEARRHYSKALSFFRQRENPDYENTIKEAVCALESAGKSLFPEAKANTLGDLLKWQRVNSQRVPMPVGINKTIEGVYALRNSANGVGHGGGTGGSVTSIDAEYTLSVCASTIIYFIDLANMTEQEVPF